MIETLRRITIVTGHYGCGKTNLAVNLAVDLLEAGKAVTVVDLDIVNPYFRSSDQRELLESKGARMICPVYANTNLDLPSLSAEIYSVFHQKDDRFVIFDVGGDDAGASALGRFSGLIKEEPYQMVYVVNRYRYLTRQPEEAVGILREVEAASRLQATGIVNNSNLGEQTTAEDIRSAMSYGKETARLCGLPLLAHTAPREIAGQIRDETIYPVDLFIRPPWEI